MLQKFQRIDEEGYDDDSDDNGEYQPSYEPESLEVNTKLRDIMHFHEACCKVERGLCL